MCIRDSLLRDVVASGGEAVVGVLWKQRFAAADFGEFLKDAGIGVVGAFFE